MRVCHVTSVHISTDTRLIVKECPALADAGHEVFLVAKGDSREERGVHVIGVGNPPESRIKRMLMFTKIVYKKALELDCEIYHLHDPELLPYGIKLKKKGKKVIFDSHEDIPGQILDKYWIPKGLRKIISGLYRSYETHAVKKFDAVVAATPHISHIFEERARKIVTINNYPKLDDIFFSESPFSKRGKNIAYAGGLDEMRGKSIILRAMEHVDGDLLIAGVKDIQANYSNVKLLGDLNRNDVNILYSDSRAGFVLYLPAANHYDAQPQKMFEYMAAGLPFVASDFPLWKEIVEENNCGICVCPTDVELVREAITRLLDNPELAQQMGRNGRKAVEEKYNWDIEREKLIKLYEEL